MYFKGYYSSIYRKPAGTLAKKRKTKRFFPITKCNLKKQCKKNWLILVSLSLTSKAAKKAQKRHTEMCDRAMQMMDRIGRFLDKYENETSESE